MGQFRRQLSLYAKGNGDYTAMASCTSATYATARSGGGSTGTGYPYGELGQAKSGSNFTCSQIASYFDLAVLPDDAAIEWAKVGIALCTQGFDQDALGWKGDHTTLHLHSGLGITFPYSGADFIAGATMAALPLLGTLETTALALSGYCYFDCNGDVIDEAFDLPNSKAVFVMCCKNFEDGVAPTDRNDAYVQLFSMAASTTSHSAIELVVGFTTDFEDDPDTAGGTTIMVRPFATRSGGADNVVKLCEDGPATWWEEEGPGQTIRARAELIPQTPDTVPRSRWFQVNRSTPGVTVNYREHGENLPDYIRVIYKAYNVTGVPDGQIRSAWYPSEPTSAAARLKTANQSGAYMTEAQAAAYAQAEYQRYAEPSTITVQGGIRNVDGAFVTAPLLRWGDFIEATDRRGHAPVHVTGALYDVATDTMTLMTGGEEKRTVITPGMSALPAALTPYVASEYQQAATTDYTDTSTGDSGDDGGDDDTEDKYDRPGDIATPGKFKPPSWTEPEPPDPYVLPEDDEIRKKPGAGFL